MLRSEPIPIQAGWPPLMCRASPTNMALNNGSVDERVALSSVVVRLPITGAGISPFGKPTTVVRQTDHDISANRPRRIGLRGGKSSRSTPSPRNPGCP